MKNLCNSAFVPLCMLALASCCQAAGTPVAAVQHNSAIESLCLARDAGRSEVTVMETRLTSVPALLPDLGRLVFEPVVPSHCATRSRPYYRRPGDERRLRLTLVEGLSHGWADSAQAGELRRTIGRWFNTYLSG